MKRIIAISLNNFKESVRQKIFIIIIIFGILLLITSFFLFPLSVGEQSKIIRDFGLSIITFLNIVILIITGGTLIYKEIEKRTIYITLSAPVRRNEVIIGKFIGLFLVILINLISMSILHQILIFFTDKRFDPEIFISLFPFLFEISIMIALMILFSSFSSYLFSSFMGAIIYLIGHSIESLKEFAEISKSTFLKIISYIFYYLLPNLEIFNIKNEVVYKNLPSLNYFLFSTSYGIAYTIFLLILSIIIFEKREFK